VLISVSGFESELNSVSKPALPMMSREALPDHSSALIVGGDPGEFLETSSISFFIRMTHSQALVQNSGYRFLTALVLNAGRRFVR